GGYTGCLGGARCRGFGGAVWNEDEDDEQAAAGTIMALAAATIPPTDHEQGGTVYRTVQDHPDCGADTPWAVTDDEGELQGCYATQAEADAACAGMADDSDSNDDHACACGVGFRSEEHTSELQSREKLVCRLLLEKKNR